MLNEPYTQIFINDNSNCEIHNDGNIMDGIYEILSDNIFCSQSLIKNIKIRNYPLLSCKKFLFDI